MFASFTSPIVTPKKGKLMNNRTRGIIVIAGVATIAFAIGYSKGQTRTIRELGRATTNEAIAYLATSDFIRNRKG